jgi:hypothetical protein
MSDPDGPAPLELVRGFLNTSGLNRILEARWSVTGLIFGLARLPLEF